MKSNRRPTPASDLDRPFARVVKAARAARISEVEESMWFGTPSLKVRGKSFMRVKDSDTIVLMCPLEEKELLIAAEPAIFFETDHYKGWPAILVRLSKIGDVELRHRLERAWRFRAPKRLITELDQAAPPTTTRRGRRSSTG